MTPRAWGNEYRATTVCIDAYDANGILSGRFYNPFLESGRQFNSLMQFLLELDQALDAMAFPQPYTVTRTFTPSERKAAGPPEEEFRSGRIATFTVRVIFRQNSSWQGTVTWLEGGQEQSFRSALELIFLLDNALSHQQKQIG